MEIETRVFEGLGYVIRFPDGYSEGRTYPVLLFLHGAGSRGSDIEQLCRHPFFQLTARHSGLPLICVAPQCPENSWFDIFETLERFSVYLAHQPYTDASRLSLMGASMGGYAVWQLAMSLPELFAAAVPICGGGMYWNAARLADMPIWAFHGALDPVVLPEESQKMVDAVKQNGGDARLTVYPHNSHDAWSDTYTDPEVFRWLLEQRRTERRKADDAFHGAKLYG